MGNRLQLHLLFNIQRLMTKNCNRQISMKWVYNNMEQLSVTKYNHLEIQSVKKLDM